MIHFLANSITNYLFKQEIIQDDLPIYQYGFELAISSLIGIFLVLITAVFLADVWSGAIFIFSFLFLRSYTGGLHFDTYLKCNAGMLTIFLVCIFVVNNSGLQIIAISMNLLALVSIFLIIIYAPLEHKNKPLEQINKLKFRRLSIIISTIYYLIGSVFHLLHIKYYIVVYYVIIITSLLLVIQIGKEKVT